MNSPYLKKDCYYINVRNYSDMIDPFSSISKHACTLDWISHINEGVDLPILRLMLEL